MFWRGKTSGEKVDPKAQIQSYIDFVFISNNFRVVRKEVLWMILG